MSMITCHVTSLRMLQKSYTSALPYLAFIFLLGIQRSAVVSEVMGSRLIKEADPESADPNQGNWELGSGSSFLSDLFSIPADSPFMTETPGNTANCSHRFWLPLSWENIAGPEEFEQSRLLVLQNRAALQAMSQSSGVEEGEASYEQQAKDDVQGVQTDHQTVAETILAMQKVFFELEGKRREGKEHWAFSSIKEQILITKELIHSREQGAAFLENQFFNLERSFNLMQQRIDELMAH